MTDRNTPSPVPRLATPAPTPPVPRWIGAAVLPPAGGTETGGEESGPGYGLTALGPVHAQRKAREWALVLQSSDMWHLVQLTRAGWVLLVRDEDYLKASRAIDRYEAENRDWPPRPQRERPRHPQSAFAAMVFAALALFFTITGPAAGASAWFRRGTAVADMMLQTEPWRAVTALTLHADTAHVLGNVISGTIFGSAVQRRLGPGGAALAIVTSGALGNVANALWHRGVLGQGHASIGASTAVFGAIGLLVTTQLLLDRTHAAGMKRTIWQRVAPVVGGLALLGALGASPRADLGAHLFGLLVGGVIGLAAGLGLRGKATSRRRWLQPALGAVAALLVVGSWQLAWIR
ncbi:rhomboid family intramembrane serine protease [Chondromyces apiculatus]|uniref:Rhomboid family protein n=1 Tax=Chondromyces apiculatus DSM 436 TaxID=1192034 RepID=A0A017T8K7_9BACT|nr:rhomboid family intramembrane serine protease [Chondromyces apiculatus]EYF05317.1 rhomboid family protein [Chondromyces apiculatus DSM 436]